MGICTKCGVNKTNLQCASHGKSVCEACLIPGQQQQQTGTSTTVSPVDHFTCKVVPFKEWLANPEALRSAGVGLKCTVCDQVLGDPLLTIRLSCLDVFHIECIERFCSSLPLTTARAGFACPTCNKPLLPKCDNPGPLLSNVLKVLSPKINSLTLAPTPTPVQQTSPEASNFAPPQIITPIQPAFTFSPSPSLYHHPIVPLQLPTPPTTTPAFPLTHIGINPSTTLPSFVAPIRPAFTSNEQGSTIVQLQDDGNSTSFSTAQSRRPQPSPLLLLDADEDKYHKRTCSQLLQCLGLKSTPGHRNKGCCCCCCCGGMKWLVVLLTLMVVVVVVVVVVRTINENEAYPVETVNRN
ncbi:hypothetical protein Pelo_4823 [Pelomyxa schiedti]|nr:hypothetical protein Pelo_4823 [Pelomyxa schiedti]